MVATPSIKHQISQLYGLKARKHVVLGSLNVRELPSAWTESQYLMIRSAFDHVDEMIYHMIIASGGEKPDDHCIVTMATMILAMVILKKENYIILYTLIYSI